MKRHIKKFHVYDRKQIDKHDTPDVDNLKSVTDISVNPSKGIQTPTHECMSDYATSRSYHLSKHIKGVHEKSKDQKCQKCDFKSSYKDRMTRHIRAVHDKMKNHKCTKCDYATSRGDLLIVHVRKVHDKIKEYKCNKCDFVTSRGDKLNAHVRAVHEKLEGKMS